MRRRIRLVGVLLRRRRNQWCILGSAKQLCPEAKRCSLLHSGALTVTGLESVTFSSYDRKVTGAHALNELIAKLFDIFHTRYLVWKWETQTERRSATASHGRAPERPSQDVFDAAASLSTHDRVRSPLIGRMVYDNKLCWPVGDIVQNDPDSEGAAVLDASDFEEVMPAAPGPSSGAANAVNGCDARDVPDLPAADVRPTKRRRLGRANDVVDGSGLEPVEARVTRSRVEDIWQLRIRADAVQLKLSSQCAIPAARHDKQMRKDQA